VHGLHRVAANACAGDGAIHVFLSGLVLERCKGSAKHYEVQETACGIYRCLEHSRVRDVLELLPLDVGPDRIKTKTLKDLKN